MGGELHATIEQAETFLTQTPQCSRIWPPEKLEDRDLVRNASELRRVLNAAGMAEARGGNGAELLRASRLIAKLDAIVGRISLYPTAGILEEITFGPALCNRERIITIFTRLRRKPPPSGGG